VARDQGSKEAKQGQIRCWSNTS